MEPSKETHPTEEQIKAWQMNASKEFPGYQMHFDTRTSEFGDEYLLYFEKISAKATNPVGPIFPEKPNWLPLEMLWRETGESELDFLLALASASEIDKLDNHFTWGIRSYFKKISPFVSWLLCTFLSGLAILIGVLVIGYIVPITVISPFYLQIYVPWFVSLELLLLFSSVWLAKSSNSPRKTIFTSLSGSLIGIFFILSLCLNDKASSTEMNNWAILRTLIIAFLNVSLSFLVVKKIVRKDAIQ
jgi:uncharacterized membrane protein YjfL (UPF0719 family)